MPDMQECWHPVHPRPQSPDSRPLILRQSARYPCDRKPHPAGEHGGLSVQAYPLFLLPRPILQSRNQFRNPARNVRNADRLNGLSSVHYASRMESAPRVAMPPPVKIIAMPHCLRRNPSRASISSALMPTWFHNATHTGGENSGTRRAMHKF